VLVPPTPGVLSASGLVTADEQLDFSVSRYLELAPENVATMASLFEELEARAADTLSSVDEYRLERSVDLRYDGQVSGLTVRLLDQEVDDEVVQTAKERFHDQYEEVYGHAHRDAPVQAMTWRISAVDEQDVPTFDSNPASHEADIESARKGTRDVYVDGEFVPTPVYDRYSLPVDESIRGPALVEETESTTVVHDESTLRVEESGNMLLENGAQPGERYDCWERPFY